VGTESIFDARASKAAELASWFSIFALDLDPELGSDAEVLEILEALV
jgi:hypothetical protein